MPVIPVQIDSRQIKIDRLAGAGLYRSGSTPATQQLATGEGPGIDITADAVGLGGDTILVFDASGSPVAEYAQTTDGLTSAFAIANTGDVVKLHPCNISGSFTVPANVGFVSEGHQSVVQGPIALSDGSQMQDIKIISSGSVTVGIIGPSSGSAYILDCSVQLTNSGSGNVVATQDSGGGMEIRNCHLEVNSNTGIAYAYAVTAGGLIEAHECVAIGNSTSGSGYAGRFTNGTLNIWGGRAIGSTSRFIGS